MLTPLPNEELVLGAIHRLLAAAKSGRGVVEAQESFLSETARLPLKSFDQWERRIRNETWAAESKPSPLGWKLWSRPTHFLSWLDVCSSDGFRRERLLRTMSGGAPNPFLLVLAIRRLNDWVPQVRAAARECIPNLAGRSEPQCVAEALWATLAHWTHWGRIEGKDRELLLDSLANTQIASAFKQRLIEAKAGPAAQILSQAGRAPALDPWLPEVATAAIQPSVRAKACRSLLEKRMVWVRCLKWAWTDIKWCKGRFLPVLEERAISHQCSTHQVFQIAIGDRSPMVRRVAAEFLIANPSAVGAEAAKYAAQLATDSSSYVAERGRFALELLHKRS